MKASKKYQRPKDPVRDEAMELMAEVEKRRSEIGIKWGEHRFKNLIDPDLRNRLKMMINKYEKVKAGIRYFQTVEMAKGMLRGLDQCEANAIKRGHKELTGDVWSYYDERTNTEFLLVKDDAYYPKALAMSKKEDPQPVVCSLVELLRLVPDDNWIFVHKLKEQIPGSKVIEPLTDEDMKNLPLITSFDI
tara:strand:+ start:68 stop:637 length:570 start_codon:yes stop_codon:yes gene_type:complete